MDLVTLGTGIASAVVVFATLLPKIMAGLKRDKLDATVATTQISQVDGIQSTYEKQILSLTDRLSKMESRMNEMDKIIHDQAIKVTKLIIVVIQLKSIITSAHIVIPQELLDEIDLLTNPITPKPPESP